MLVIGSARLIYSRKRSEEFIFRTVESERLKNIEFIAYGLQNRSFGQMRPKSSASNRHDGRSTSSMADLYRPSNLGEVAVIQTEMLIIRPYPI